MDRRIDGEEICLAVFENEWALMVHFSKGNVMTEKQKLLLLLPFLLGCYWELVWKEDFFSSFLTPSKNIGQMNTKSRNCLNFLTFWNLRFTVIIAAFFFFLHFYFFKFIIFTLYSVIFLKLFFSHFSLFSIFFALCKLINYYWSFTYKKICIVCKSIYWNLLFFLYQLFIFVA